MKILVKHLFYTVVHPFDGFFETKRRNKGSVLIATMVLLLYGIINIVRTQYTGFIMNETNLSQINSIKIFLTGILPIVLLIVSNFSCTSLMNGNGTLKDIYIVICYALVPMIAFELGCVLLSRGIILEEAPILIAVNWIGKLWFAYLVFCGLCVVHEYSVSKNIVTILATFMAAIIIIFLCVLYFTLMGKVVSFVGTVGTEVSKRWGANRYEMSNEETFALGKEIGQNEGRVQIGESENLLLYLETDSLNVIVKDKASGLTWEAVRADGNDEDKSLVVIEYFGEDNEVKRWDSYHYAVKNGTYEIRELENGAEILLDISEPDSFRLNEYLPQKISIEKYESRFVSGLENLVEQGLISEADAAKYLDTLSIVYAKDPEQGCYYNRFSQAPPLSAVKQLIEIAKRLNYTTDQLIEDNAEFDIAVKIEEPAHFKLPIDVYLEDDCLKVEVSTDRVENLNEYYALSSIQLFADFGACKAEEAKEGFLFIPDGTGALLKLNSFDPNYGNYKRALYDNTYFSDYYYLNEYNEKLGMPVFGMITKKEKASGGFLCIVESGDQTAYVGAALASEADDTGNLFNKVYSSFDTNKYQNISILGPYDSGGGTFMASTGLLHIHYKLRYQFFHGDVTYYDFAKEYKSYLKDRLELSECAPAEEPALFFNVTGTLSVKKHILGVPYEKQVAMTDFEQLSEIVRDFTDFVPIINYQGFFNGGLDHSLMNGSGYDRILGSKKELEELVAAIGEKNGKLYLETDFSKIYKAPLTFRASKYAIHGLDDSPAQIYGYDLARGILDENTADYYLLNPIYLGNVVNAFQKKPIDYAGLSVEGLASDYFASYGKDEVLSPKEAQSLIHEELAKLADSNELVLQNPFMNEIGFCDLASDISRESCGWGGIYCDIPFKQLVLNGLCRYTTTSINESGKADAYFLLQAFELASIPKYSITAENLDVLKNTVHSDFLSREYKTLKEDIVALNDSYKKGLEDIGSTLITNHEMLEKNVFVTSYENGTKVIVNYNHYPVETAVGELPALGYKIIGKGEQK
ncbi:MAG: YIP1 family protein [Acetatifactor sp.]|nr:YIP1 family protein [Acetatifactor sp.]